MLSGLANTYKPLMQDFAAGPVRTWSGSTHVGIPGAIHNLTCFVDRIVFPLTSFTVSSGAGRTITLQTHCENFTTNNAFKTLLFEKYVSIIS